MKLKIIVAFFALLVAWHHQSDIPQRPMLEIPRQPTKIPVSHAILFLFFRLFSFFYVSTLAFTISMFLFTRCCSVLNVRQSSILNQLWNLKIKTTLVVLLLLGYVRQTKFSRSIKELSAGEPSSILQDLVLTERIIDITRRLRFLGACNRPPILRSSVKNHDFSLIRRMLLLSSGSVEQ